MHGDDITSDSSGEDCYRFVKAANRFKVVKRTPSISTTDLVGRMLLCTRTHFIKSLENVLVGSEGPGTEAEKKELGESMTERMRVYSTDETGKKPGADVYFWKGTEAAKVADTEEEKGTFRRLFDGVGPKIGQRVVYVDGGFDLFSSGHIEFLRRVITTEEDLAQKEGWYDDQSVNERIGKGGDYGPAFVVAGVHDDDVINQWKGVNYPIMNIFERGLCVLQCKVGNPRTMHRTPTNFSQYVNAVIFGAPFTPTKSYLSSLPWGTPDAVYHGPTSFMPLTYDPYTAPKAMGIYRESGPHPFESVNAGTIVQRILKSRDLYEARQRAKGMKSEVEDAHKHREMLEQEQKEKEAARNEAAGKEI